MFLLYQLDFVVTLDVDVVITFILRVDQNESLCVDVLVVCIIFELYKLTCDCCYL